MSESLFSGENIVPQDHLQEIKHLILLITSEISKSDKIKELFSIWKKVGYRISDEEYTSSKQQVRKENPSDENLMKIYSVECFIAFLLRLISIRKIDTDFKISTISDFISHTKKMRQTGFYFLFDEDVYDIWTYLAESSNIREIESYLINSVNPLLKSVVNLKIQQIFLVLHQTILDQESRKLLGEFYTPIELSEIIIKKGLQYTENESKVLDLSCGSGSLLLTYLEQKIKISPTDFDIQNIIGMDINPLAIIMSKFALGFFQNENRKENGKGCQIKRGNKEEKIEKKGKNESNLIEEPLIFCSDSLISYANYHKKKVLGKLQANLQSFLANQANLNHLAKGSKDKHKFFDFQIEFLGSLFELNLSDRLFHKYDNELNNIRISMREEIKKAIDSQADDILLPLELKQLIQTSVLKEYFMILLADKICAFFALGLKYDFIIGNPPYLRLQSIHPLWKRDALKKAFRSAVGHYDIYYLFIELGISLLSQTGILAYITSNKFITTGSGNSIRKIITERCTLKSLIDFGDSHVFEALVLPIILILQNTRTENKFQMTTLKKAEFDKGEIHSLTQLMDLLIGNDEYKEQNWHVDSRSFITIKRFYRVQPDGTDNWNFIDEQFSQILEEIKKQSTTTLGEISQKIIVGIKTTANYAFINDYTHDFINKPDILEERNRIIKKYGMDLFQPLIQGVDIRDYKVKIQNDRDSKFIFFPHFKDSTKGLTAIPEEDLPVMLAYLKQKGYYETLSKREYIIESKRNWYEIWNTKDPDLMERDLKIVVPDISPKNNFAIDYNKRYVDGSAYFIVLKNESKEYYQYILGLLNSYVCEFFHKVNSGNCIYAGRYRYWATNIKFLPLVMPSETRNELFDEVVEKVKLLENEYSTELEDYLNDVVFQIFRLSPETQKIIRDWVLSKRQFTSKSNVK